MTRSEFLSMDWSDSQIGLECRMAIAERSLI